MNLPLTVDLNLTADSRQRGMKRIAIHLAEACPAARGIIRVSDDFADIQDRRRRSCSRRPVLIEFLGTPGSGKTTLCSAVVAELRRDGFSITTRKEYFEWVRQPTHKKLVGIVTGGLRTWYFVVLLTRFLYGATLLRGRPLFKAIYELACMRLWLFRTVDRAKCSAIILDEFACNRLALRLRESPLAESAGPQLVRLLYLFYPCCDTHWIFKTVRPELAAQRISWRPMLNSRTAKPIEALPAARQGALLSQQIQLLEFIFDAIRDRGRQNGHNVDGAIPMKEQVTSTKTLLAELLSDVDPSVQRRGDNFLRIGQ